MNKQLVTYFNGDSLAAQVWLSKYKDGDEVTPDDMHRRLAKAFSEVTPFYSEEAIYTAFANFQYIVPQGSVMAIIGTDIIGSASNCFIIGQPHDSYGGIMQKDQQMVQLMKRRGGVGIDISTLRPANAPVQNAAKTSTGATSFMHRYSNSTREVAQAGRRGALMISMNIVHPDSEEFINMKQDLTKVTGANVSLQIPDDFMEAVRDNKDYILRWPCDTVLTDEIIARASILEKDILDTVGDVYIRVVNANKLYNLLVHNAWLSAEPGQLFVDKHWNYSPDGVYKVYKGVGVNPCGEIFTQPMDSCRLMALNLYGFVDDPFTENAKFNIIKFRKYAYMQQVLADALVDLEIAQIDKIIAKIDRDDAPEEIKRTERDLWVSIRESGLNGRRTGCGFTALGDTLAALGLPYDSEAAMTFIDMIMNVKMDAELEASIELAKLYGPFKGFDTELEYTVTDDGSVVGANPFYELIRTSFPARYLEMMMYGRRNVSWSTVAPTGSVSILTQTSSGLEPVYKVFYTRRVKINPDSSQRVDFVDQNGDSWTEYPVMHPKFKYWINSTFDLKELYNVDSDEELTADNLTELYERSPWYKSEADDIDWMKRVEVQSVIQKYTSHSISSTINLPNTATHQDVYDIYMHAWQTGLKGITIYRDGSRTGVLVSGTDTTFKQHDAPKRPAQVPADLYHIVAMGRRWTVCVGLLEEKPYEVFVSPTVFGTHGQRGYIVKKKKKQYSFEVDGNVVNGDIAHGMTGEEAALTRMVSTSLRHGAKIDFVIDQLNSAEGAIVSFSKAISRALKRYSTAQKLTCSDCKSDNIIMEEGCMRCLSCGSSKCG